MQVINKLSDWHWLKSKPLVFIFKHSSSCPISKYAYSQLVAVEKEIDVPIYLLTVQEAGELSSFLADQLGVEHATPQLLLVQDGEVKAVLSHNKIERTAVLLLLQDY